MNLCTVLKGFPYISEIFSNIPDSASICLFKVNKRNARTRCKICSKLTLNIFLILFWCLGCRLGIFANFDLSRLLVKFKWNFLEFLKYDCPPPIPKLIRFFLRCSEPKKTWLVNIVKGLRRVFFHWKLFCAVLSIFYKAFDTIYFKWQIGMSEWIRINHLFLGNKRYLRYLGIYDMINFFLKNICQIIADHLRYNKIA